MPEPKRERPTEPKTPLTGEAASQRPKLRYLEILPFQHEGEPRALLRDPLEISPGMLAVSPQLLGLMALMDGTRTVEEIRSLIASHSEQPFPAGLVEDLVRQFDEIYFFDNERFENRRSEVAKEFGSQERRLARHAGKSYPADPLQLQDTLNSFYLAKDGAGLPQRSSAKPLQAIVAPHIDLRNGGPIYTHAYRALAESQKPDLFVILGTGHMGLPEMFSVSPKPFETPLGATPVDGDFLKAFRESAGPSRFQEDLTHRNEHTIEFQVVFLQHLYREAQIPILPVLTSFSFEDLQRKRSRRLFELFVNGFKKAQNLTGKRVCLIASADLAHIGPRYGDEFEPDQGLIEKVSTQDLQMLEPVKRGDAEGFYEFVKEEKDQRRICGFSPIYALLHMLEGRPGKTLSHSHTLMDESGSFVTYASLVF